MAAGGANLTAAVHIEALANDGDSEAGWAKAVSADATFPVYLVAFADLSAPGAGAKLKQLQDTLGTEVGTHGRGVPGHIPGCVSAAGVPVRGS